MLGRIGIQTGSHVSLDGLLEFLGKAAGMLLWDDNLGKHENGGLKHKNAILGNMKTGGPNI